jgi:hypothetical protein
MPDGLDQLDAAGAELAKGALSSSPRLAGLRGGTTVGRGALRAARNDAGWAGDGEPWRRTVATARNRRTGGGAAGRGGAGNLPELRFPTASGAG